MTGEADFHDALDADYRDWQTRVVFADWLQEQGDPRAEGYRVLGMLQKHPQRIRNGLWVSLISSGIRNGYYWARLARSATVDAVNFDHLDADWYALLDDHSPDDGASKGYDTRLGADEAAVAAFLKLPAKRQAELLTAATKIVQSRTLP